MRLSQFNPALLWCPDGRGYSYQLAFDCPTCGPPHRIMICCRTTGEPTPGIWHITIPAEPTGDGWNGLTVRPSIQNHDHGHKKTCAHHCSVVAGELLP